MPANEILIEVRRIGHALRVTAFDTATGTEVTFQAPSSTGQLALQRLAASKLRYVIGKGSV